jgi:MoaA/NifB/PqqE/SkfB family radical SAM enzyme
MALLNQFEPQKHNKLALEKPLAYNKILQFTDKLKRGESIAIVHLQYNYACNFRCEHCSIKNLQYKPTNKRKLTPNDIKNISKQADELGLARWVITGGEPLIFPDLDELVAAIDPTKFYINCDTNGWNLNKEKAKHLKEIGIDRIQLSLDSLDEQAHDEFRNMPGSFKRTLEAIDIAKNVGLDIIIMTVVTKQRLYSDEFVKFLEFLNNKNVGVFVSYAKPVGAWEGHFDSMINAEDKVYMRMLEQKHHVFTHLTPGFGRDLGCIALKGIFTITQYGDVMPCQYIFTSIGNVLEEPLKDIIDRGMKIKHFGEWTDVCWIAEDKQFVNDYVVKNIYGKEQPVPSDKVFSEKDVTVIPFNEHMIKHGLIQI